MSEISSSEKIVWKSCKCLQTTSSCKSLYTLCTMKELHNALCEVKRRYIFFSQKFKGTCFDEVDAFSHRSESYAVLCCSAAAAESPPLRRRRRPVKRDGPLAGDRRRRLGWPQALSRPVLPERSGPRRQGTADHVLTYRQGPRDGVQTGDTC